MAGIEAPIARRYFGGIHVALRIDRDIVRTPEVARRGAPFAANTQVRAHGTSFLILEQIGAGERGLDRPRANGKPNHKGMPKWDPVIPGKVNTMISDTKVQESTNFDQEQIAMLSE